MNIDPLEAVITWLAAALTTAGGRVAGKHRYGEAWATLGFILDRTGHRADALAASRMAVTLEPDNWRHHLRLGYVSWGEERLREARRTLALLPGFPLAHWLAATVHVARQAFDFEDIVLGDAVLLAACLDDSEHGDLPLSARSIVRALGSRPRPVAPW